MKSFSLTFKFLIPVLLVFVVIAVFLSYQTSVMVKNILIDQSSSLVVDFVQIQARNHITSASDFSLQDPQKTEQVFQEVLREVKTRDVIRIKVWDKDATIIFSDDKSIVGKKFTDNHEFQEAIQGEVEVEIKEPVAEENVAEKGYRQLMEVYVPITLAGESGVSGVIETYYNLDALNSNIQKAQTRIIFINLGAFLVFSLIIRFFFKFFVLKPLEVLESGMEEIKQKEA